jgi:hypothetical protein
MKLEPPFSTLAAIQWALFRYWLAQRLIDLA